MTSTRAPVQRRDPEALVAAATSGDRAAVARLISLVEEGGELAQVVGRLVYPLAGNAYTVGVTGAPGAGKSTLTDRLIKLVRSHGEEVGVLAVDPSSPLSGGAILGDRVRMEEHVTDPGVFIRSMATRGHLGGLALATPEAIRVLDAAGLPLVLVETVGVGQVEVEIVAAADTTVVVLNPGWGDAVQANKAGLLETADAFVINKADRPGSDEAARDLNHMLDMYLAEPEWRPPIVRTVASTGEGVEEAWAAVEAHRTYLEESGELRRRRAKRIEDELRSIVMHVLERKALEHVKRVRSQRLRQELLARRIDPYTAANEILRG